MCPQRNIIQHLAGSCSSSSDQIVKIPEWYWLLCLRPKEMLRIGVRQQDNHLFGPTCSSLHPGPLAMVYYYTEATSLKQSYEDSSVDTEFVGPLRTGITWGLWAGSSAIGRASGMSFSLGTAWVS